VVIRPPPQFQLREIGRLLSAGGNAYFVKGVPASGASGANDGIPDTLNKINHLG
jgi:hypothetical protein